MTQKYAMKIYISLEKMYKSHSASKKTGEISWWVYLPLYPSMFGCTGYLGVTLGVSFLQV